MPDSVIADLRSDTITQPTPEMRRAMAEAPVGDDGREGDPTAQRIEHMAAQLTGHQAALFCTSGTMGNLVAFLTCLRPGDEIIAERNSHFLHFEAGGVSALAGAIPRTLPGRAGRMDLDQLEDEIRPGDRLRPGTALIVAENTHNLAGGTCLDPDYMQRLWQIARSHEIPVHLDGARLFNAAVALGVPARHLAAGSDSVMIDLSKGLCAPYGSLLCAGADFIARARHMRQRVGGNVRQIGHMAAAGIIALETMIDRLAEDHANARRLAEGIARIRPGLIALDLVHTNIIYLDTTPLALPAAQVAARLDELGVRCLPMDPHRLRFVTHHDVTADQIDRALNVTADVLRSLSGS
jgi:threonine aldolase